MTIALLFNSRNSRARIGSVFFDATLSETHETSSTTTNFPVEDGSFISDFVITNPETLNISGLITDTPLNFLLGFNRSVSAYNELLRLQKNKELLTVVTGIKIYENMILTSISVPRDSQSGKSLTFNINLQKIIIDNSTLINVDENNPFLKTQEVINREQVAENERYPFIQLDPPLSLKDQSESTFEIGYQLLQPINPEIIFNLEEQNNKFLEVI